MLIRVLRFFENNHYENHKGHANTLCSKILSFLR